VDVLEPDQKAKKYLVDHPRRCRSFSPETPTSPPCTTRRSYPIHVVIDRDGNIAGEQRGAGERGLRQMLRRAGLESQE
jgi:hypothetical protein